MRHGRIIAAVVTALSTAALWPAGAAADDVLVVTRTNDLNGVCASGVACSLREAIALANSDPDNDVVVIPPGDYTLDLPLAGQLAVTAPVTIVGTGTPRNTSVRGAGSRVLKTSADTVLAGFTVRDGNGQDGGLLPGPVSPRGGGIWQAAGKLTLANMRVTANQVDSATATGGGIQHDGAGTLTIASTLVDSNLAKGGTADGQLGRGGGILAAGSGAVTIASSTLTANGVQGAAGSQGGGLATDLGSSVALVNATIAANTAAGAGMLGGNIAPGGSVPTVSARNTIVSGGTAPSGANCSGGLSSQGNNLELGSGCGLERNLDPGLGALADNGGPTDTLAITTASPAFDAGTDAGCPAIDQRGQPRPQGRVCDIGAFEVVAARPTQPGAGNGSGAGGSGRPSADTSPPVLARLAVAPFAFRSAPSGPSVRAAARRPPPVGALVSHTLSEAATVAYVVERSLPRNRWAAMTGAFARRGVRGANRFRFTGRLSGKRLGPGRYRLLAIARDAAGNVSRLVRREFRIVP
jgi:CSLREA domain-containing protein